MIASYGFGSILVGSATGILQSVLQRLGNKDAYPASISDQQHRQNRQRLLDKVRIYWVEGVLNKSLYAEARLELGMKIDPEAIANPWDMILQQPDSPNRTLPRGTKIIEIFDSVAGELLILGEPGSGKTTTLLELARDLTARAEADETLPTPVVLNLSSWASVRKPLREWLVDELNTKYQVPKKVGKAWVDADSLTLLLDGLDEVNADFRNECLYKINSFRVEHAVNTVICSRIAEYDALKGKLNLQSATVLQSLTPEQVDKYLATFGDNMRGVRYAFHFNSAFQELIQTPLMLSIAMLAYGGQQTANLIVHGQMSLDELPGRLFEAYIQRMFERKTQDRRYAPATTLHWLSVLADLMATYEQTVFYIEDIQPRWLYRKLVRGLYSLLYIGLMELFFAITLSNIIGAFIPATLFGLDSEREIKMVERVTWTMSFIIVGIVVSSISLVTFSLLEYFFDQPTGIFASAIIGGISFLLFTVLRLHMYELRLIWVSSLWGFGVGFFNTNLVVRLPFSIGINVMISITISALAFGLLGLIPSQNVIKTIPNQGTRDTAKNAMIYGMIFLSFGTITLTILGIHDIRNFVTVGAIGFYFFGGQALIKHILLRFILWRQGSIPWNYARFLDYAAERIFLRKVGGGYIFVHRLLLEYFASLEEPASPS